MHTTFKKVKERCSPKHLAFESQKACSKVSCLSSFSNNLLINDSQIKYEMIEKTEEMEDYMRKRDINKTCSGELSLQERKSAI